MIRSARQGSTARRLSILSLFVGLGLAAALSYVVLEPSLLAGLVRAGASTQQGGHARVAVGDRHVDVQFKEPFPTAPIVQLTARTATRSTAIVRNVSARRFRIELSGRADADIDFAWSASWERQRWSEFDDGEAPPVDLAEFHFDDHAIRVDTTGKSLYLPTEFWIDADQLPDGALDVDDLKRALLDAARTAHNAELDCSLVESIRAKLRLRARACPPRPIYDELPSWSAANPDDWRVEEHSDGLRIVRGDHAVSASDDDAIRNSLAQLMSSAYAFDVMPHNNQVIDFLDALIEDGRLSEAQALTIIHFDSHSDLNAYRDPRTFRPREHIGDFLNTLIDRGLVKDIYWVMPDWTDEPPFRSLFADTTVEPLQGNLYAARHYDRGPRQLDLFVDTSTGQTYVEAAPMHVDPSLLRQVRFFKLRLDELPDFSSVDDVYLELDADYFSNTGYHTAAFGSDNPSRDDLRSLLHRVVGKLTDVGVVPMLGSICLSPRYTARDDLPYLQRMFIEAANVAGLNDYLVGYRHLTISGSSEFAHNVRRTDPLANLALDLALLDATAFLADQKIWIADGGDEFTEALSLVQARLGVNRRTAESTLIRMDRFDGRLDGSLDLVDFEYYLATEDAGWVLPSAQSRR